MLNTKVILNILLGCSIFLLNSHANEITPYNEWRENYQVSQRESLKQCDSETWIHFVNDINGYDSGKLDCMMFEEMLSMLHYFEETASLDDWDFMEDKSRIQMHGMYTVPIIAEIVQFISQKDVEEAVQLCSETLEEYNYPDPLPEVHSVHFEKYIRTVRLRFQNKNTKQTASIHCTAKIEHLNINDHPHQTLSYNDCEINEIVPPLKKTRDTQKLREFLNFANNNRTFNIEL